MERVLPIWAALANRHPERTVFTRFIPPEVPTRCRACGAVLRTLARRDPRGAAAAKAARLRRCYSIRPIQGVSAPLEFLKLMPPLASLCPPATTIDKTRHSDFAEPGLIDLLRQRGGGLPCQNIISGLGHRGIEEAKRQRAKAAKKGWTRI